MKPEEIKIYDWMRIFTGLVPPSFYLELAIRAFLVFALLVFCMRLMGKRMSAKLSQLELVAIVSLASAVGIPMLAPDRGLSPSLLIAAVVVGISWVVSKISFNHQRFEEITQGTVDTVVEDSVLQYGCMERVRISRERLFAHLRGEGVQHMGEVKRVYLETNGVFTVFKNEKPEPGLMVLPDWDGDYTTRKLQVANTDVCVQCGEKKSNAKPDNTCVQCGKKDWVKAVVAK